MAANETAIELYEGFSDSIYNISNSANQAAGAMTAMQEIMNTPVDVTSLDEARGTIDQMIVGIQELETVNIDLPVLEVSEVPAVELPAEWELAPMEVFTEAEFDQVIQMQAVLCIVVVNMDIWAANNAYQELSSSVSEVEENIQDNVTKQEELNSEIESTGSRLGKLFGAFSMKDMIGGIKKAFKFMDDCTSAFDAQMNAEWKLMTTLGNTLDADYIARYEVEAQVSANTTAAVDEINAIQGSAGDVEITVSAGRSAVKASFDEITSKAAEIQSKGIFRDEVMIAGAAELSAHFTDTDAITTMMDTLSDYAIGRNGGAGELDSSAMTSYAAELNKIMSGSYDAMTEKGLQFTDAQKAIIEGTATEAQIVSTLGAEYVSVSSDMQAAAAINSAIGESWGGLYETMSNTPQGKIIQLNNSFGNMKEVIGGQLYPFLMLFVNAISDNWPTIEMIAAGITTGLQFMVGIFSWLLEGALAVAGAICDNWSWIGPIIYSIVAALALYGAYLAITKGWELAASAVKGIMATASMIATAAQNGLNAALAACPLVWIILLIAALIAVFYAVVGAINRVTGASTSATGLICGAFATVGAFVGNVFMALLKIVFGVVEYFYNWFVAVANFIGNIFNDPIAAVINLFADLADNVLGVLEKIASALDFIFGSNMADAVSGWRSNLKTMAKDAVKEYGNGTYEEQVSELDIDSILADFGITLERFNYGDAFNAGYEFGEKFEDFNFKDLFGAEEILPIEDYLSGYDGVGGIGNDISDIAGNTGSMANSMDISQEELKYLRDLAEQETVNRFTTAEIKIEQTNNNRIDKGMDLDGVISGLTNAANEAVDMIAEGVPA